MVNNMNPEYNFKVVDESELDELLSGRNSEQSILWNRWSMSSNHNLLPGSTGVVWINEKDDKLVHPLALICQENDIRRLCGRYAHLCSDLSPLTVWCHLLTPRFFESLESMERTTDLNGIAAWTGLIVAEAILLTEKPIANVRISACLATQSFAIARTNALWSHVSIEDTIKRFNAANRLCRNGSMAQTKSRAERIRTSLEPIWRTLAAFSRGGGPYKFNEFNPIVDALQSLQRARENGDKGEAYQFVRTLLQYVPEAEILQDLADMPPESRLEIFDKLVDALNNSQSQHTELRRNILAIIAGYIATIAAGGSPSLSLAESHASRWPEITAWAYVIGGIGERVTWTSSFDGLGRLVARELGRPFKLDEPPTCDFAFDEASVLADSKLSDPLVFLRIKQARLVTVELFPGVNVVIPLADTTVSHEAAKTELNRSSRIAGSDTAPREPINALIDALWPYLEVRIDDHIRSAMDINMLQDTENLRRKNGKHKSDSQTQFPLGGPKSKIIRR